MTLPRRSTPMQRTNSTVDAAFGSHQPQTHSPFINNNAADAHSPTEPCLSTYSPTYRTSDSPLSLTHYLVQIQHDFVKNHPLLPVIYEFLHEIKSRRCGVAVLKTDVGSEPDIIPMEPLVTPTTNFRIPFTSITYRYLSLLDEFLQNHLSSSTHLADMNTPYNDEWGYSAQNMESTGEPFSSKPSQSAVPPHVSYSTELNKQLLMVRERYSMALGQLSSIYTEFGMRMSDLLHQQASLRPMTESEYYNKMKFVQQKFEMICNQLFNNVCTAITILQSHHQGYSMAHHTDASATLSQIWASQ